MAISDLSTAKEARPVFGAVTTFLIMTRVSFFHFRDEVDKAHT